MRAYIQQSTASVAELAAGLGVSGTAIRRWKKRSTTTDGSHTPHRLSISLNPVEEDLVRELRVKLGLALDDITEVMHRCINPKLSRDAIYRCLRRAGLNRRPVPEKRGVGTFETATVGFVHVDLKYLPALEKKKTYVFAAIAWRSRRGAAHRPGDALRLH